MYYDSHQDVDRLLHDNMMIDNDDDNLAFIYAVATQVTNQ
jgi:hypothetical protein